MGVEDLKFVEAQTVDDANDIARQFAKKKRSLGGVVKLLVFFGGKFFYDRRTTVVPAGAAIVYLLWTKAVTLGLLAKLGGLAFLGYLAYRILQARSLISTELTPAVSVKKLDCYQQPDLLAKAWKQAVAVSYGKIVPQPVEGYCGHATLLNAMLSIPGRSKLFRLPPVVRPLDLAEMHYLGEQLQSFDPALKIKSVKSLSNMTYPEFLTVMRDLNNPKSRYLCNFLRGPMFFTDPKEPKAPLFKRLFAGHWSPLGAYISNADARSDSKVSTGGDETDLVMVLDVNATYGAYLVPARRLYDAVNTRPLLDGSWRGLIKLELE